MPHQCTNCGLTFPDGSKEMLSGCPDCGGNKFQFHPGSVDRVEKQTTETVNENPATQRTQNPDQQQPSTTQNPDQQQPSTEQPLQSSSEATQNNTKSGYTPWPSQRNTDATDSTPSQAPDSPPTDSPKQNQPPSKTRQQSTDSDPVSDKPIDAVTNDAVVERSDTQTELEAAETPAEEDSAQVSARTDVVSNEELAAARTQSDTTESQPDEPSPDLEQLRNELNEQFESIKILNPGQYEINLMELYDRDEYIISLREDGRYVIEVPDGWGISDTDE
ncbi:OapC/ArvC family zinc-ribbon domain-containing protein [Natronocalculus amylovorans]|uniref:Origin-associated protein OapC n=1 Tax=Natronocalculus amylovorans TaxID=2917812 RepID=A0AAE3FW97_9EURY|nr:Zn-ribbon containing protein [Natronocalculus amylovorans]MCL9816065.1 hypothetical protein [Natronocalculus amylovorans]NUE01416.1 hypothetical protein [Halorubraceae archaeon YAN]